MNREEVDRFLSEADDVIEDWEGSQDSASWSPGREDEAVTGHYGDIARRSNVAVLGRGMAMNPQQRAQYLGMHWGSHAADQDRAEARARAEHRLQRRGIPSTREALWLAEEFPPPAALSRDNLWPRATADAFPGRFHSSYAHLHRDQLWEAVLEASRAGRLPWRYLTGERLALSEALLGDAEIQPHYLRIERFGDGHVSWPVLVNESGEVCGPVTERVMLYG